MLPNELLFPDYYAEYTPPPILELFDRHRAREKLPSTEYTFENHVVALRKLGILDRFTLLSGRFLFMTNDELFGSGWSGTEEKNIRRGCELQSKHIGLGSTIFEMFDKRSIFTNHFGVQALEQLALLSARLLTFERDFLALPSFRQCVEDARLMLHVAEQQLDQSGLLYDVFIEKYGGLAGCFPFFREPYQRIRDLGKLSVEGRSMTFLKFDMSYPRQEILSAISRRRKLDFHQVEIVKMPSYSRVWLAEVVAYLWLKERRQDCSLSAAQDRRLFKQLLSETIICCGQVGLPISDNQPGFISLFSPRHETQAQNFDWENFVATNVPEIIKLCKKIRTSHVYDLYSRA
ncbi:hypothetical protein [Kordiimonas lacus]|uniref:Uncharacterized protein n=1 Tax=Kordiimonas lacus TaxID=637679 RepID=A0A1G6U5R1_9PROT|nr:hypothetical protein [Kordiimonas lacus]SDD36762.1 hypothetical protein SAMN04488071_0483 [Kordiimonas lacus]